jgi:hypothetical protein
MKKIFAIALIATSMVACNNSGEKKEGGDTATKDTAGQTVTPPAQDTNTPPAQDTTAKIQVLQHLLLLSKRFQASNSIEGLPAWEGPLSLGKGRN